jgi:hypothetical protein
MGPNSATTSSLQRLLVSALSVPAFVILGWVFGYTWSNNFVQAQSIGAGIALISGVLVVFGGACLALNVYLFKTTTPSPKVAYALTTRTSSAVSSMISGAAVACGLWLQTFAVVGDL